jgi:cytoskeletal protein CcmA (bactofilin family)
MFKRKQSKDIKIDNLIGPRTRINGDVEFFGGFHLDGTINGNVTCEAGVDAVLSVSEAGCIAGSVSAPNVLLNGTVKGDIDATGRVELGAKARVLGSVRYAVIETAVGAQINGKLIHRAPEGDRVAAGGAAGTGHAGGPGGGAAAGYAAGGSADGEPAGGHAGAATGHAAGAPGTPGHGPGSQT